MPWLALDENLAEAHAVLGWIEMAYDWDWIGSDASLQRALQLEAENPMAVRFTATLAYSQGRFEEALSLYRRVVELDPLHPSAYYFLGKYTYNTGHFDEATAAFKKILELYPEYRGPICFLASLTCAVAHNGGNGRNQGGERAVAATLWLCLGISCSRKEERSGYGPGGADRKLSGRFCLSDC